MLKKRCRGGIFIVYIKTDFFQNRIDELNNRVIQLELANRKMRESNVKMQARVEQEEEYISNMLLKRIRKLKSDKESIALKYEQEEEMLTNSLSKKLFQLEKQRDELITRLNMEQNSMMESLLQKVRKLESEMRQNQTVLFFYKIKVLTYIIYFSFWISYEKTKLIWKTLWNKSKNLYLIVLANESLNWKEKNAICARC